MDAWRQFVRHRTLSINEYSTRYSEAIDDRQGTSPSQWRLQSQANKQGSVGNVDLKTGGMLSMYETEFHTQADELYKKRLDMGVAREQARKDLPLSTYTEAYVEDDLRCWMHFLGLRMDRHAQYEIRQYANRIGHIIGLWAPTAYKAFVDYQLCGKTFSKQEMALIREMLQSASKEYLADATANVLSDKRERREFLEKVK